MDGVWGYGKPLYSCMTRPVSTDLQHVHVRQPPKFPSPNIQLPCTICLASDKPTGLHYGVIACHACKVFYRRYSVMQKSRILTCKSTPADKCHPGLKRFSCISCRFKRCVLAGMKESAVKRGRYCLEMKHRVIRAHNQLKENRRSMKSLETNVVFNVISMISRQPLTLCVVNRAFTSRGLRWILVISGMALDQLKSYIPQAPPGYFDLMVTFQQQVEDKFSQHLCLYNPKYNTEVGEAAGQMQTVPDEQMLVNIVSLRDPQKIITMREKDGDQALLRQMVRLILSEQISKDAVLLTQLTKFIPEFKEINFRKQLVLIKNALSQLVVLLWAYMTDVNKRVLYRLHGGNNLLLTCSVSLLYHITGMDIEQDLYMKLVQRLWNLKLEPAEIGLVISIMIVNPDQPNISCGTNIEEIQQHLITCLQHSFKLNHPKDPHIFCQFMSLLPTINEIGQHFLESAIK